MRHRGSMGLRLHPLDESLLADLLELAVGSAEPEEVMPPVAGPPGWTDIRRQAFVDFHRARFGGFAGPEATVMYGILTDGGIAGMIRLAKTSVPDEYETGMWLGRRYRGKGLAAAALRAVLAQARALGGAAVIAETTPENAAALGTLRSCGAELRDDRASGKVTARFSLLPR